MRVSFRQGIVSHQTPNPFTITGGNANIIANDRSMTVSIAHRDTDYIHSEDASVIGAWVGPFDSGTVYWLYWDFNSITFARTFGITTLEPIYQATAPTGVSDGQMWYDTSNHLHYEYVAGSWVQVLRVFAAKLVNSVDFIGMSAVGSNFAGSQISDTTSVFAGRILLDQSGKPILRTNKTLFTTEDEFFTNQSRVDAIRLESNVTRAVSLDSSIAEFTVVAWTEDGKVTSASYDDVGSTVIGIMTETTAINETGAIITQGSITNPSWNWTASVDVGAPLWVGAGVTKGLLITTDPHLNDPITYNVGQVPVARVLSADTIIFEQGLGGKGDTGPTGPAGNSLIATTSSLGSVLLHTEANNPGAPAVITDLDPRLSDSRAPLAGSSFYVNLDGDTMTDLLVLSGDPAVDLGAATKQYVDGVSLNDLSNVVVAGSPLITGQTLTFDGTNWVNGAGSGGGNWLIANGGEDFATAPVSGTAGYNSIAIGDAANANSTRSIAIGENALATHQGLALGLNAVNGSGSSSISIGNGASTGALGSSMSIGISASSSGLGSVSLGQDTNTPKNISIAIGRGATAWRQEEICIGAYATTANGVIGAGSIVIGRGSTITAGYAYNCTIVGRGSRANESYQVVIGQALDETKVTTTDVEHSIKIGSGSAADINILHMHNKGKLELVGDEAQFIVPKYTSGLEPLNPVEGSLIYDQSLNVMKAYDGASWNEVGGSGSVLSINVQTASYTLALSDGGNMVYMNVASANNVTIPTNASVAFPIGTEITVAQQGAGITTFAVGAGSPPTVTINSAGGLLALASQYSGGSLVKTGTDTWLLVGDLA